LDKSSSQAELNRLDSYWWFLQGWRCKLTWTIRKTKAYSCL